VRDARSINRSNLIELEAIALEPIRNKRFSPPPRITGAIERSISSTRPAARYWLTADAPAGKPDVLPGRRLLCAGERRFDAVGDEIERGAAGHRKRLARVVGEHEHRVVVGRFSPHQPRQDSSRQGPRTGPNILRPMIVAPRFARRSSTTAELAFDLALRPTMHLPDRAQREEPLVQVRAADSERVFFTRA
jgi:hypothetical protein